MNPYGVRDGEDGLVTLYPGLIARGYAYLIPTGLLSIWATGRESKICGRGGKHNVVKAQMNRYDSIGGDSLTYDEARDLTGNPNGNEFEYDYESRMVQVLYDTDEVIAEYAYDDLGRRIEKDDKIAGEKTRYYYNDNWQVLKETDDNNNALRWYVYGNYIDEVLVMVAPNEQNDYYYAHNHLHSPGAEDEGGGRFDHGGSPVNLFPNWRRVYITGEGLMEEFRFEGEAEDGDFYLLLGVVGVTEFDAEI